MAHLHEAIDLTVAISRVARGQVMLVPQRKMNPWLPLGGHIELDEDPEQAAWDEVMDCPAPLAEKGDGPL